MEFPAHIFRTYDIRGLLAEVTPEIAERAAQVLIRSTSARTVVVGRDMRATSPELSRAAIGAITAMGVRVIDVGTCTTPLFSFSVRHLGADAGLMITASHNPPEYNGMKFADKDGLPISGKQILPGMKVELDRAENSGDIQEGSALDAYLDACIDWPGADLISGSKVVADFGNGMGAMTIRPLAKKLGVDLVEMYAEPNADFPNHEANPAKEETLTDIKKEILLQKADVGVALDGDADRIAFIDNEGKSLRGDLALAIFAENVLEQSPGAKIVVSPNQSWATVEAIEQLGGVIVECPIGRTLVIQKMAAEGAVLSGEVSSHFFFPEFGNLEAPEHAFVRMLAQWKNSGKTFADFVRPLRRFANSGEINFEFTDKEKTWELVKQTYVHQATGVNEIDGIRCDFGHDWWFIARLSNNEPLLRLTIEATSEDLLQTRIKEMSDLLKSVGCTPILKH